MRCRPTIMGDAQQLRQVIHNLLQNAQDATETASAGQRRSRHPHASGSDSGKRVRLTVQDSGTGFPGAHPQARLRALRHDQGQGHRPGPGGRQENRRRARRAHRTEQPHRRWGRAGGPSVAIIRAAAELQSVAHSNTSLKHSQLAATDSSIRHWRTRQWQTYWWSTTSWASATCSPKF